MVSKEQVERDFKSYAPGSVPQIIGANLLGSENAGDGLPGMQGNRNQLVGSILHAGVISGFFLSSPSPGQMDIGPGVMLVYDEGINEFVVLETKSTINLTGIVSGEIIFARANDSVVTFYHSKTPSGTAPFYIAVYTGTTFVDLRRSQHVMSSGSANFAQNMYIGGPDNTAKLRIQNENGEDVFRVDTVNNEISAYTAVEHVINADRLGGFQDFPDESSPSTTSYVPVADPAKTLQPNLNADLLDGRDAGHSNGNIPINDRTLNTNLNADLLDHRDAGNSNGDIPINNGIVNTNLNADKIDGQHYADIQDYLYSIGMITGNNAKNLPLSPVIAPNSNARLSTNDIRVFMGPSSSIPVILTYHLTGIPYSQGDVYNPARTLRVGAGSLSLYISGNGQIDHFVVYGVTADTRDTKFSDFTVRGETGNYGYSFTAFDASAYKQIGVYLEGNYTSGSAAITGVSLWCWYE